jgi:hypothetical protein
MSKNEKAQGWWHTFPGIVTAVATFIGAVTGLIVALNQIGLFESRTKKATLKSAEFPEAVQAVLDNVCSVDGIPFERGMLKPTNSEQRVRLYLRCEAMGGPPDGFTNKSCCDHLTLVDGESIGLCPATDSGRA